MIAPGPVKQAVEHAPAYEDLKPAALWKYFAEMAAIPHPSYHEAAVQARLAELAREQGCDVKQDNAGNLVVSVRATGGLDKSETLVVQAHTDMVSVKRDNSLHDFERDPITLVTDLYSDEPIVRADNTTLGADNGIGAACALALMESDLPHPPLELLLTVNEESGMTGAKGLDPSLVSGRRMLNLDSEEDDTIYIGCVGGAAAFLTWTAALSDVEDDMQFVEVTVSGLKGGHSGLEIHQPRGNAHQILANILSALPQGSWALASSNNYFTISQKIVEAREKSETTCKYTLLVAYFSQNHKKTIYLNFCVLVVSTPYRCATNLFSFLLVSVFYY